MRRNSLTQQVLTQATNANGLKKGKRSMEVKVIGPMDQEKSGCLQRDGKLLCLRMNRNLPGLRYEWRKKDTGRDALE